MATYEDVTQARTAATEAGQTAGSLAAGTYTVEEELKNKINEAYNYNKDIVGPLDVAQSEYLYLLQQPGRNIRTFLIHSQESLWSLSIQLTNLSQCLPFLMF